MLMTSLHFTEGALTRLQESTDFSEFCIYQVNQMLMESASWDVYLNIGGILQHGLSGG